MINTKSEEIVGGIAIVGIAGRFPGAKNVNEFWANIRDGVESISHFQVDELEIPNASEVARNPNYIRARSIVNDADLFDADFFGILPKEAERIDPQHRIFLENCWEAIEEAGYDPQAYQGAIAVFAGCSANTYFLRNLCSDPNFIEEYTNAYQIGHYQTLLGTNNDFLATRVSYKLNLKGPSFTIQCGCSTSLVAVTQACQSLLSYQSDMALAGGVSITFPQKRGYLHQEGGMGSRDGHCRTFDAEAQGTVFGSGSAVVLLKRLEDAIADGDHIHAVIRGSAVNNDGSMKVGYTAPGAEGQAEVVAMAHALADVDPSTIGYLEAHGTATPLGDPIEFQGLTRGFRSNTSAKQFCALGTAKMNIGHLDIASGVTGLINAVQIIKHQQFPPSIHFKSPNEKIDLENSPFYVNTKLRPWISDESPRRAGVSSFGVGGTNAHVVIEEAPDRFVETMERKPRLFLLSARSPEALEKATENLQVHLEENPSIDLGEVSYTLQSGRRAFDHRRIVVSDDLRDLIGALKLRDPRLVFDGTPSRRASSVVFMFPGQGSQYVNMGRDLYESVESFRNDVDLCSDLLIPLLGFDPRTILYPRADFEPKSLPDIKETQFAQPSLFIIEYALARLWISWGIQPNAMIGHSVGEVAAACIAGVFSLEDALYLIATRCRLMQDLPRGGMLSVRLGEKAIQPHLNEELSLAASNSPNLTVVAGSDESLDLLENELRQKGIASRRLATSHAFHSSMMDPIIETFTNALTKIKFKPPSRPYVSCVTGHWIKPEEATDPAYWARHFRRTVRFAEALLPLKALDSATYIEVGPGSTLCTLLKQNRPGDKEVASLASMANVEDRKLDLAVLLSSLGRLWLQGLTPDWPTLHSKKPRRCSLPTYPFERKRHWIDPISKDSHSKMASQLHSSTPLVFPLNEDSMDRTEPSVVASHSSLTRIKSQLAEIFEDLSGLKISESDYDVNFLEMGFDSLFLTQVSQSLQAKFDLKIRFRQLLDQQSTIVSLALYIVDQADPQLLQEPKPEVELITTCLEPPLEHATNPPVTSPSPLVSMTGMESIVREQLQVMSTLMARQLDFLGSSAKAEPKTESGASPAIPAAFTKPMKPVETMESAPIAAKDFKAFGPYKPVQRGNLGELTAQQSQYLTSLIERYTAKTKGSKAYTQDHRKVLADPRVAAGFRSLWKEMVYPIVTVRSQGAYLWDIDGNRYIDILNGFGPIMFGHAPDFITSALRSQLESGFEIGPQCVLAGEVASLVCELTGMERATFCNTGSEAVMAALRVARTVTARKKIVLFAGAYHGTFDEVLVKSIKKGEGYSTLPIAPGISSEAVANVMVLPYGTPESLDYIREHARELAAVLVEPVQSRHPALQPVEFLKEIRAITQASGTALIFDEVVTGFRVHPGGAQALLGIKADLVTYGKVVGGGLPIGILAGSHVFMDALDGGDWRYGDDSYPEVGVTFFAGTFVRHPLALAATRAVLLHLKTEGPDLQVKLNERTTKFVQAINREFELREVPTRLESFGSVFYFSFPPEQRFGSLIYYHLREQGIHIQEGFPCYLTTAHTQADIDAAVEAFRHSIDMMQRGGALAIPSNGLPATCSGSSQTPCVLEYPLTEEQNEIWLSARLSDDASCAFNEAFSIPLQGPIDRSALTSSFQILIDRHDVLRSKFDSVRNVAKIAERMKIEIPFLDLESHSAGSPDTKFREFLRGNAEEPFDMSNGPLVRASLVRLGAEDHVLVVTSHHLVCDGWSTNILVDELQRLYNARLSGSFAELPKPASFRDFAEGERWRIGSAEHSATEAWWIEQFQRPVTPLQLPLDHPRAALKSFKGDTARHLVNAETTKALRRFGATNGCTLFVTLLTGFKILLSRFSGQSDIVVGIPAAGQSLLDDPILVGHCVNFLPIRSNVEGELSAVSFMKQVKSSLLDASEHQRYTYGSLVRKLGQPRDPSRLPLVEVQFNLERLGGNLQFDGLKAKVDPIPKRFVNFDLFLNVIESEEGMAIDCDYNRDLFERETIERWLSHYVNLLNGMLADPKSSIAALPLLGDVDREQLSRCWSQTGSAYQSHICLHELIEKQVERTPNAVAAIFEEKALTYAKLDGQANALATQLRGMGVRPGERVAVCLHRSLEMLVSLYAVLKAGAAYVPIDPGYPSDRIEAVLDESSPILLITQSEIAARLNPIQVQVVSLREIDMIIDHPVELKPDNLASSADLAYLIFTSGSTGKPKGVEITHRSVVNFLESMAIAPGMTSADTILAITTLSFDIAVLELWLPLILGASVEIVSREAAGDGKALRERLEKSDISVLQATPATWRLLLEAGWDGSPRLKALCGGEALSRELADQILPRVESLWNMYGPTETTVWSGILKVEPGAGPIRIGPPIANTRFHVLDPLHSMLPIGVPGELYIGGDGLARGYWNQPNLTAEKFVEKSLDGREVERLYATGDLVRSLPDGTLEFLGRLDSQVKVRGFRIETSEVESVLIRHQSIKECVVVAQPDSSGEKRLVAYLVVGSSIPAPNELRAFVSKSLPGYMVPSIFQEIDAIPRTPNGKLDRRNLPIAKPSVMTRRNVDIHSVSPRERLLVTICSDVLKLKDLSVDDNLLDLGADSIHVFQIVARAGDAGLHLTANQILLERTIESICKNIDDESQNEASFSIPKLVPVSRELYRTSTKF